MSGRCHRCSRDNRWSGGTYRRDRRYGADNAAARRVGHDSERAAGGAPRAYRVRSGARIGLSIARRLRTPQLLARRCGRQPDTCVGNVHARHATTLPTPLLRERFLLSYLGKFRDTVLARAVRLRGERALAALRRRVQAVGLRTRLGLLAALQGVDDLDNRFGREVLLWSAKTRT